MEFTLASLFAGFFFSVFGFYVLGRGRHFGDWRRIAIGLVLIIQSYFIANVIALWLIGASLLWLAYLLSR